MIKKEVSEIKKQYAAKDCAIGKICTCYVNGEQQILSETIDSFLSLPEEECFKYAEIFKKALSGSLGKNLLNLEFPLEEEKENGTQARLYELLNTDLKDEQVRRFLYEDIIASFSYSYTGNYVIILAECHYDVPGKASDGMTMEDASEEVYHSFLCCLCPVELSKPGLSYDEEKKRLKNRDRDWIVKMPEVAFLFPAFNDRSTDLHACLYYVKDNKKSHEQLAKDVLGCTLPIPVEEQKMSFQAIISKTLGTECDYETVRTIHENLNEMIEESEGEETLVLGKAQIRNLFEQSGVPEEALKDFDANFDMELGEKAELVANNLAEKTFQVKTSNIIIKVEPEMSNLIQTKIVDGKNCLVIAVEDGVEINGISVTNK